MTGRLGFEIPPTIYPLNQILKKGRGRKGNELRKKVKGKRGNGEGEKGEGKPVEPGEEMEEKREARWPPRQLHVKTLTSKPEYLSSILRTHMAQGGT